MTEDEKIELIKKILLSDDRKVIDELTSHIQKVEDKINNQVQMEPVVEPIIDQKLATFKESIPEDLGPSITSALKKQIAESQDEVLDILHPIMGKLIQKFIKSEMQKLTEKIDEKLSKAFSFAGFRRKMKSWFSGANEAELVMQELDAPHLVEVLLIEKESGILLGKYSKDEMMDSDMVAGMLTAIKSFVEDAFNAKDQSLEVIEYNSYKIQLRAFQTFYVACVVEGTLNANFRGKLETSILNFVEEYLITKKLEEKTSNKEELREQLEKYFKNADI